MGAGSPDVILTAVAKADAMDPYAPSASGVVLPSGARHTPSLPRCSRPGQSCSASGWRALTAVIRTNTVVIAM